MEKRGGKERKRREEEKGGREGRRRAKVKCTIKITVFKLSVHKTVITDQMQMFAMLLVYLLSQYV